MLATGPTKDGKGKVLIVGLEQRNVEMLLNDRPIERAFVVLLGEGCPPELRDWTLFILGPEDTERLKAQVAGGEVGIGDTDG